MIHCGWKCVCIMRIAFVAQPKCHQMSLIYQALDAFDVKFSKMNFFIFSLAQQIRASSKMCLNQRLPRQIYSQFNAYSHTRFVRYSNKHCFARETNQQNRLSSIFFSFESLFALCVLTGNATINIGWNIHFSVKTNRLR